MEHYENPAPTPSYLSMNLGVPVQAPPALYDDPLWQVYEDLVKPGGWIADEVCAPGVDSPDAVSEPAFPRPGHRPPGNARSTAPRRSYQHVARFTPGSRPDSLSSGPSLAHHPSRRLPGDRRQRHDLPRLESGHRPRCSP